MSLRIVILLGDDILIMELKKRLFALPLHDEGVELIVEFERIHRYSASVSRYRSVSWFH